MSRNRSIAVVALVAFMMAGSPSHGADPIGESDSVLAYTGKPIHVLTPVSGERLIEFRRSVQVAVPRALLDSIAVESIAGMVYLRAKTAFGKERFRFRDMDTGEVFVLDISAVDNAPTSALVFMDQRGMDAGSSNKSVSEDKTETSTSKAQLTRHVFQQVYSPSRLVRSLHDVQQVSLSNDSVVERLLPGEKVRAKPLGQWKTSSGLYATAVQLLNTGSREVVLDPRRLRAAGHWLSAGYMQNSLKPFGSRGDSLLLVVVGTKTWEDSTTWLR